MEENNVIEDNPTRRVATKGVFMDTYRSTVGTRDTRNRGK